MLRNLVANLELVFGVAILVWAAYGYVEAARGGSEDISATGWLIYATVGAVVGVGLIYVSRRTHRRPG